jgi:hypothetical protein
VDRNNAGLLGAGAGGVAVIGIRSVQSQISPGPLHRLTPPLLPKIPVANLSCVDKCVNAQFLLKIDHSAASSRL